MQKLPRDSTFWAASSPWSNTNMSSFDSLYSSKLRFDKNIIILTKMTNLSFPFGFVPWLRSTLVLQKTPLIKKWLQKLPKWYQLPIISKWLVYIFFKATWIGYQSLWYKREVEMKNYRDSQVSFTKVLKWTTMLDIFDIISHLWFFLDLCV